MEERTGIEQASDVARKQASGRGGVGGGGWVVRGGRWWGSRFRLAPSSNDDVAAWANAILVMQHPRDSSCILHHLQPPSLFDGPFNHVGRHSYKLVNRSPCTSGTWPNIVQPHIECDSRPVLIDRQYGTAGSTGTTYPPSGCAARGASDRFTPYYSLACSSLFLACPIRSRHPREMA